MSGIFYRLFWTILYRIYTLIILHGNHAVTLNLKVIVILLWPINNLICPIKRNFDMKGMTNWANCKTTYLMSMSICEKRKFFFYIVQYNINLYCRKIKMAILYTFGKKKKNGVLYTFCKCVQFLPRFVKFTLQVQCKYIRVHPPVSKTKWPLRFAWLCL